MSALLYAIVCQKYALPDEPFQHPLTVGPVDSQVIYGLLARIVAYTDTDSPHLHGFFLSYMHAECVQIPQQGTAGGRVHLSFKTRGSVASHPLCSRVPWPASNRILTVYEA